MREVTDDNTRWRRNDTICKLDTSGYIHTHSEYVIMIVFPTATTVARMGLNVTPIVYCLHCLY